MPDAPPPPAPLTRVELTALNAYLHPVHSRLYKAAQRLRERGAAGDLSDAMTDAMMATQGLRAALLQAWSEAERPAGGDRRPLPRWAPDENGQAGGFEATPLDPRARTMPPVDAPVTPGSPVTPGLPFGAGEGSALVRDARPRRRQR